jgi:hypothetical protein
MNMLVKSSAVVAVAAAPATALADHAPQPAAAPGQSRPELLALGDQLRLLFPEWLELEPKTKALHEQAMKAAGFYELGMDRTEEQQKAADAKFEKAMSQNGYRQCYDRLNVLSDKMWKLSRSILRIPADDRRGDGIRAAAVLVLDSDSDGYEAGQLLWEMAAGAGFAVPLAVAKKMRRKGAQKKAAKFKPDPIFAVIDRYRVAFEEHGKTCKGEPIPFDTPEHAAWEAAQDIAAEKHAASAREICRTVPTTIAGVAAAIRIVEESIPTGCSIPRHFTYSNSGKTCEDAFFKSLRTAAERLAGVEA